MWRKIPVEGQRLQYIFVVGNGKDSYVRIASEDSIGFECEARDFTIQTLCNGKVVVETMAKGDTDLGVKIAPNEPMRIHQAELEFHGDDEEWDESMARWQDGSRSPLTWMINEVKIVLSPL